MCGITGFFKSDLFSDVSVIETMTGALSHRGPDHQNYYSDDTVALGHARLSIIDLSSNANQPITSSNGRYIMVFNGEIYNYKSIAKELGTVVNSSSDTAVLIAAYEHWGEQFIDHLNGMFAMAIYDRETKSIQLWRDRIGIKPLYYYFDGSSFAFASELKAICKLPIERRINKKAIQDYLYLEYIPEPLSVYENCFKLEKGHSIKFSAASLVKTCYYNLLDRIQPGPLKETDAYMSEFDELFTSSIKNRMVSDVPVGAFLSGGADSSAVCAAFQENATSSINTFTIGFNESSHDESTYAAKVSDHLRTNHHTSMLSDHDARKHVTQIFNFFDEPFAVSSVLPMFRVSEDARKKVKVVMSGDGGDELFMGYGYYNWHKRIATLQKFGGESAPALVSKLINPWGNRYKRASRVLDYKDKQRSWIHTWSQEQYMFNEKEIERLLGEPYKHETLYKDWQKIGQVDGDDFLKISLLDIRHYLANNLLHKVDITTMTNGLEARVPFLDHRLVEFSVNLPTSLKIKDGIQKHLLKQWLTQKLPKELVYRKKWGFPAPMAQWLQGDLKHLTGKYLSPQALENTNVFNVEEVSELLKRFYAGEYIHHKRIWAIICFQMWYEQQEF